MMGIGNPKAVGSQKPHPVVVGNSYNLFFEKFAFRPEGDLSRFYEPVIEAIASSGSAIEIPQIGDRMSFQAKPTMTKLKMVGIKMAER